MRSVCIALGLAALAWSAQAEGPGCHVAAAEKKLAGAAKKSFLTKCEKDAKAMCETKAAEKKLAGAAKNSFTGKCVRDAVGVSAQ